MTSIALAAWLLAVWLLLWEDASAANVVSGLAVIGVLAFLFPREGPKGSHRVRPLAALRFGAHFLAKLVEASAAVAWEVVTPRQRIREGIVAVPLRSRSRGITTLVANAVSLTPGTLSLHVDEDEEAGERTLYVHVLHLRAPDEVRADVARFEALAVRAFGAGGDGGEAPAEPGNR